MDYTIDEAAARTGLTKHTLRYYEREGLLPPITKATSGHRRYTTTTSAGCGCCNCSVPPGCRSGR